MGRPVGGERAVGEFAQRFGFLGIERGEEFTLGGGDAPVGVFEYALSGGGEGEDVAAAVLGAASGAVVRGHRRARG